MNDFSGLIPDKKRHFLPATPLNNCVFEIICDYLYERCKDDPLLNLSTSIRLAIIQASQIVVDSIFVVRYCR